MWLRTASESHNYDPGVVAIYPTVSSGEHLNDSRNGGLSNLSFSSYFSGKCVHLSNSLGIPCLPI